MPANIAPATMLAVAPRAAGGPEVLSASERPTPVPGQGQALVKVSFAGVNRHDCGQRARGTPPAGATDILGLEISGTIVAVGEGVDAARIGEEVCALVNGGGYAEYCVADIDLILPRPALLSMREAAALPEALFTAWFNLVELGGLGEGKRVLIHGGTSGVGSMAIQLVRSLGAHVMTTAGSAEKCKACLDLGAERAINYRTDDFVAATLEQTQGHGADIILDMAGGTYAERNLEALARDGVVIHLTSGSVQDYHAPLRLIMERRARVTGSLMRSLEPARKSAVAAALRARVWPLLGSKIRPVLDQEFPLADAVEAHRRIEGGAHIGKILLATREAGVV